MKGKALFGLLALFIAVPAVMQAPWLLLLGLAVYVPVRMFFIHRDIRRKRGGTD